MVRLARCETLDPSEVSVAHVFTRVVRRCFLLGDDPVSGKNFDHRKVWIEQYLQHFSACFGVDLLAFSILSNHFHLILRSRPDVVATWSDEEVARRWLLLCPHRRSPDGSPAQPSEPEINSIAGCPVKCAEIRSRLSDISWWMRLLCQRVAMRANRDDGETGRFFQDRYKAVKLVDEASLLACAAYVDLNPIRAAIAQTLETSDHPSVQHRIEAMVREREATETHAIAPEREGSEVRTKPPVDPLHRSDDFLAPLTIDEATGEVGPCVSGTGKRASDKGFLPMSLTDYLQLLDWTAREVRPGKTGSTGRDVPGVIQRLGWELTAWTEFVRESGKLFQCVTDQPDNVHRLRSQRTQRRFHLRRRVRDLMPSSD